MPGAPSLRLFSGARVGNLKCIECRINRAIIGAPCPSFEIWGTTDTPYRNCGCGVIAGGGVVVAGGVEVAGGVVVTGGVPGVELAGGGVV